LLVFGGGPLFTLLKQVLKLVFKQPLAALSACLLVGQGELVGALSLAKHLPALLWGKIRRVLDCLWGNFGRHGEHATAPVKLKVIMLALSFVREEFC
jgi:hypothetical protein